MSISCRAKCWLGPKGLNCFIRYWSKYSTLSTCIYSHVFLGIYTRNKDSLQIFLYNYLINKTLFQRTVIILFFSFSIHLFNVWNNDTWTFVPFYVCYAFWLLSTYCTVFLWLLHSLHSTLIYFLLSIYSLLQLFFLYLICVCISFLFLRSGCFPIVVVFYL
jgi:hypothetical protein